MGERRERDGGAIEKETPDGTGVHGAPNRESPAGQSSATGWDMNKTKPTGAPSARKAEREPTEPTSRVGRDST